MTRVTTEVIVVRLGVTAINFNGALDQVSLGAQVTDTRWKESTTVLGPAEQPRGGTTVCEVRLPDGIAIVLNTVNGKPGTNVT